LRSTRERSSSSSRMRRVCSLTLLSLLPSTELTPFLNPQLPPFLLKIAVKVKQEQNIDFVHFKNQSLMLPTLEQVLTGHRTSMNTHLIAFIRKFARRLSGDMIDIGKNMVTVGVGLGLDKVSIKNASSEDVRKIWGETNKDLPRCDALARPVSDLVLNMPVGDSDRLDEWMKDVKKKIDSALSNTKNKSTCINDSHEREEVVKFVVHTLAHIQKIFDVVFDKSVREKKTKVDWTVEVWAGKKEDNVGLKQLQDAWFIASKEPRARVRFSSPLEQEDDEKRGRE
jgi:hypothetical protein